MAGEDERVRRMNLNLLYPLDALLRAPTLTRAGSMIALSQPAMSIALRKLRDHFRDELIIYGNGEPRLTPLALELRPRVSRLLREADATLSPRAPFDPAVSQRTITLSAPEAIEILFLSRVASNLLREGPSLDVRLIPFDHTSTDALFARGADVAVVAETMLTPSLRSLPLFASRLSCLVWEDHPTIGDSMSVEEYRAARHAGLAPALEQVALLGRAMHPLVARRQVVARTERYATLPNLIVGTDMVGTMNSALAQYLAYHYPLRVVPLPVAAEPVMLFAVWEQHRDDDPMIRWTARHLAELGNRFDVTAY